ncbi:MAG: thioredoxin domain-containing protein [Burkholderiaceae bacterium]
MKRSLVALVFCSAAALAGSTLAADTAKPGQAAKSAAGVKTPAALKNGPNGKAFVPYKKKGLVAWQDWSDAAFAEAKASKKMVLLNLGAVWCHWCHVMDEKTYSDPKVAEFVKANFIPIYVDQDSRPDLSRRYEAYGWPAHVIFDADGNDIGKLRGYRESERFVNTLKAILEDPSPLYAAEDADKERQFSGPTRLDEVTRKEVERRYRASQDMEIGGLKQIQRYIPRDVVEYSITLSERGDKTAETWAKLTLKNSQKLIDPVWGGAYQYSTHSNWDNPHYEKIMEIQANMIRMYALGAKAYGDPSLIKAAQDIRRYMKAFLTSPQGAFYTSQDADRVPGEQGDGYFALGDKERRALGMPRIDTNVYTRENAWMIEALAELYSATGEQAVLDEALRAARWIVANRTNKDGSLRHGEKDQGGPFMGDNLAMGRAALSLYSVTGDRYWLKKARVASGVLARFAAPNGGGYLPSAYKEDGKLGPRANIDENMEAARFANLLYRYTGDAKDLATSEVALRYIADPEIATRFGQIPGILLATEEAAGQPLHITVVGSKKDARSAALFKSALGQAAVFRRIEWWDTAEGKLPNPDVQYPPLQKPAAFVCTNQTCSSPLYTAADIPRQIALEKQVLSAK